MSQLNNNTKSSKGKHLNYEKRVKIEALSKAGHKAKEIAEQIGCCERTIRREIKRGEVELLNSDLTTRKEYSADIAQQKHDYAATAKGPNIAIFTRLLFRRRKLTAPPRWFIILSVSPLRKEMRL